jgi:homocitrate synthase NifV
VMAARLTLDFDCGVDTRQLSTLSDLVAHASGRPLPAEKPVVGPAVFRHESGIHCGGLLEDRETYEAFPAEIVGHAPTELVLGHHSGARLLSRKLERLRARVPADLLPKLLEEIRDYSACHKTLVTDELLASLVARFKQAHGLPDLE